MGFGLKRVKTRRNDALTRVDWQQLEILLAAYYRGQGYDVEHTGTARSGSKYDGGIDLKLRRLDEYLLVQVKHWNAFKVPHNDVHQLLGIMVNEGATGAIVITSGEFSKAAIEAATRNGHVQLIDGDELRQMLGHVPEPSAQPLRSRGIEGTFIETARERLLAAAEQRIRGETRRGASRAAKWGIGFLVVKGLMLLVLLFAILWGFNTLVSMATHSLQRSQAMAPARPLQPLPTPQLEAGRAALVMTGNARPVYHPPTSKEIAESQRRADEAMRVLAPNTPEVMRMPEKAQ